MGNGRQTRKTDCRTARTNEMTLRAGFDLEIQKIRFKSHVAQWGCGRGAIFFCGSETNGLVRINGICKLGSGGCSVTLVTELSSPA